ncbi:MAG: deoxycytidine triphosphate deaminase [Candidatus Saccharibacteria bacterium]
MDFAQWSRQELIRWLDHTLLVQSHRHVREAQRELRRRPTGVLSDQEIRSAMERDDIVIEPFAPRQLNTASYDITLGEWFYICEAMPFEDNFNPWDPEDVARYYKGPYQALTNQEWSDQHRGGRLWKNIPPNAPIIVLRPGECILGHTVEFIGARRDAVTMMHARSSIGRVNISTCDDAGWGDIGYINRWTMEIRNKNNAVVPLVVGERMGQIIFFAAGPTDRSYGNEGHYQSSRNLDELRQNWKPADMLPRLQLDTDGLGVNHG